MIILRVVAGRIIAEWTVGGLRMRGEMDLSEAHQLRAGLSNAIAAVEGGLVEHDTLDDLLEQMGRAPA